MARAVVVGILAALLLGGTGCSILLDFGGDLAADAAPSDAGPADAALVPDAAPTTDAGS